MGQEIFNSIAGLLVTQFGISVGAAALCIWGAKLLGTEGVKSQFKRWEEEHKQALEYDYRQLQESYKQELDDYYKKNQERFKQELASSYSRELETHRAMEQQKTEQVRGSIAERLEGTRAAYAQDAAKVQDEVTRRHKHLDAELVATTEKLKAGLDFGTKTRLSNAEKRVEAYKALWSHMAPLSPQSDAALDRPALAATFRKWYYDFGYGLLLTWEAQDEYLFATGLLGRKAEEIPDKMVREAFSALRTQMKIDIAVYTSEEGAAQVG